MDSNLGGGAVYINNYRALSFRLYDLKLNHVGVFTQDSSINISNLKRYTREMFGVIAAEWQLAAELQ